MGFIDSTYEPALYAWLGPARDEISTEDQAEEIRDAWQEWHDSDDIDMTQDDWADWMFEKVVAILSKGGPK